MTSMLKELTHGDFEKCVDSKFQIDHGSGNLKLELVECRKITMRGRKSDEREPFSLVFRGPKAPILPQRIYAFEFGQLGTLEIFIVPIGPDEFGIRYEAIFA